MNIMNIKVKIYIAVFSSLLVTVVFFTTIKEQACFLLGKNEIVNICYEKSFYFNDEKYFRQKYRDFVTRISQSNSNLEGLVVFSNELLKRSVGVPYDKVSKAFSWVKEESLVYIVEGEDVVAFTLERSKGDHYVLYFDRDLDAFYFSYNTAIEFLPVDMGWVTQRYQSSLIIERKYFFQMRKYDPCYFEKDGAILYTESFFHNDDGYLVCDLGDYYLINKKGIGSVERVVSTDENKYVVDATMKFINWIYN